MPETSLSDATNPAASSESVPATPAATAAAADAKTAEPNTATETEAKPDEKKAEGAPEEYAEFNAPEGLTYDPAVVGEFKTLAKELNLPQTKAQEVIERLAKSQHESLAAHVAQTRAEWVEAAKADKEFGGAKFDENLSAAKAVVTKFGTPDFIAFLKDTGLGDNPEMIRVFARISKVVGEDKIHTGKPAAEAPRSGFVYSKSNFK